MARSVPLSARAYEAMRLALQQRLAHDAAFAAALAQVCGSGDHVGAFLRPAGVSLTPFAAMLGVPPSTVRHYQRLGLITPFQVNGKFRFWPHHLIQGEAVRQWRDLGLSLADIQALRAADRLGTPDEAFNVGQAHELSAVVTEKTLRPHLHAVNLMPVNDGLSPWLSAPLPPERRLKGGGILLEASRHIAPDRLLAEVRSARQKLEEQLLALQARVERARALETALGQVAGSVPPTVSPGAS